ncbi:MAG: hypothetical protein IPM06_18830 [Rhizobiales bacterium]|nr:hypothetical protein [Hyphomicrobiales bacterium]
MAINPVQGKSNQDFTGGGIATLVTTLDAAVTSGSLVVGHGTIGGNITDLLLVDNQSNSYTSSIVTTYDATNGQTAFRFYKENVTNAPTIFTLSRSGGNFNYAELTVEEFSGVATSAALTGTPAFNTQNSPGTGTDAITSTNTTPAVNGCLIYGFTQNDGGSTLASAGTGYTSGVSNATAACRSEYKIQATAAAVAATFTVAANESHITGVMAFKPASGGSATTTVESASYTHTPQDVGVKAGFSVTADSASFAFSPQNIGTAKGGAASMLAAQASFAFTPQNVGTSRTRTVDVTYLPVPGNEGYRIEWDSNSGAPYANSAEVATDVLTYAITGLAERTTYYWRYAALVAGVPQSWATEEVFTTGIDPLEAESASYAFTPQDVGTRSAAISTIGSASFAFTPQDIATSKGTGNIAITIEYAGYTFTPQNVATSAGYLVAANSASYAWTPQSVGTSSTGQEHQFSGAWRVGSYRRRHGR